MAPASSICLSESTDLAYREQVIRSAQDRIWALADAVQGLQAAHGWEGPAADALAALFDTLHMPLRAQLVPLELAEQTVRVWRHNP